MGFWDQIKEAVSAESDPLSRERAKLDREAERARARKEQGTAKSAALALKAEKLELKARRTAPRENIEIDDAEIVIAGYPHDRKGGAHLLVRPNLVELHIAGGELTLLGLRGDGVEALDRKMITSVTMTKVKMMQYAITVHGRSHDLAIDIISDEKDVVEYQVSRLREALLGA